MNAEEIIDAYEELIAKAKTIVSFWGDENKARIVIGTDRDGQQTAWIETPNASEAYGDPCLETDSTDQFPLALLDAEEGEIAVWKADQERQRKEEAAKFRAVADELCEREDRKQYERLKAKYGQ